ncbi:MAG: DNA internalization-related competence protein ComEC/Rec2 [Pseudomonadales bacterium]
MPHLPMYLWLVLLLAGIVAGVQLPAMGWLQWPQLAALALTNLLCCYWRAARPAAAVLLAMGYGYCSVQSVASRQAELQVPLPVQLVVAVNAVSRGAERRQRLSVTVLRAGGMGPALEAGARLRLGWFDGPPVAAGEHWQLRLVLRPVHSLSNPGGFDYGQWLIAKGVLATGTIRAGTRLRMTPRHGLSGLRQRVSDRLSRLPRGELLLALLLGDRGRLDSDQSALVRVTGTVHLLVVSGLHISMVAGIGMLIGRWLGLVLVAVSRRGDVRWLSVVAGAALAFSYVILAGAALPALRAFLMTLAGALLLASGRMRAAPVTLLWVLLALLLANPLVVLSAGTWLSFGAVAALLGYWSPRSSRGLALTLLLTQGLLWVVSAILLNQFGNPVAPAAAIANLLAVPLVTMLVVPVALLGTVAAELQLWPADGLLELASKLLELLWRWLEVWLDAPLWYPQRPRWYGLLALGFGVLLLMRVLCAWSLLAALVGLSVLFISSSAVVPPGEVRVLVFDVGQGSAALVRTHDHNLLFDAAPAYPGGRDLGRDLIVPSLLQLGVSRLDGLVISHDDSDHAGGAAAVQQALAVATTWRSGAAKPDGSASARCVRGTVWYWDQVRFEFLHPGESQLLHEGRAPVRRAGNEQSCTLRVSTVRAAALLTGDTGRASERALVRRGLQPVDLLLVPHHGSAGSSDRAFVRLLRPRLAIVSAGRFNQYGHPRATVRSVYESVGSQFWVTSEQGALQWSSQRPGAVTTLSGDGRAEQ